MKRASCCVQFCQLLWKNWILRKRGLCGTCCEALVPLVVFALLALLRSLFTKPTVIPMDYHLGESNLTLAMTGSQDYCPTCFLDGSLDWGTTTLSTTCASSLATWCQQQISDVSPYRQPYFSQICANVNSQVSTLTLQGLLHKDCPRANTFALASEGCFSSPSTVASSPYVMQTLSSAPSEFGQYAYNHGFKYFAIAVSDTTNQANGFFFSTPPSGSPDGSNCGSNFCPVDVDWNTLSTNPVWCGCNGTTCGGTRSWEVYRLVNSTYPTTTPSSQPSLFAAIYQAIFAGASSGGGNRFDTGDQPPQPAAAEMNFAASIRGESTSSYYSSYSADLSTIVLNTVCGTGYGRAVSGVNRGSVIGLVCPGTDPTGACARLQTYFRTVWKTYFDRFTTGGSELYNCTSNVYDETTGNWVTTSLAVNITEFVENLIHEFATEAAMVSYVQDNPDYGMNEVNIPLIFGVVLQSTGPQWAYQIHGNDTSGNAKYGFPAWTNADLKDDLSNAFYPSTWGGYSAGGSLWFTMMLDNFIISETMGTSSSAQGWQANPYIEDVLFLPTPNQASKSDLFVSLMAPVAPMLMLLAYLWPFARLVGSMVAEKEQKLKEHLGIVGIRPALFWISWGMSYFILFFVINVLCCIILKKVFQYSNMVTVFFFLTFWTDSIIALACLTYTIFTRSTPAIVFSFLELILLFAPSFGSSSSSPYSVSTGVGLSLFSPCAFAFGINQILRKEGAFQGVQSDNMGDMIDNYTFSTAMGFFWLDTIIYFFLAWYLDKVLPSEFGTHLPPWFLFTREYWCGHRITPAEQHLATEPLSPHGEGSEEFIENVSDALKNTAGVKIKGLVKTFKGSNGTHYAVNGLNLDIYEGQIFVLLGHNGAGKTTTVNMLTGMLPLSGGSAWVYNYPVQGGMTDIRQIMGVCPQQNVLYPTLTVQEHVHLFARLKGYKSSDLPELTTTCIKEVGLSHALDQRADTLSGGQKRRLLLALAFLGDSKVVYLDEPTSGVDPASRRAIWDLLLAKKRDRVIVLTTHFMDEADELGDRIGIMHKGQLKCCGTPIFLKGRYGVGYNITMSKAPDCDPNQVKHLITKYVPKSTLLSNVGTELAFRLPLEESPSFPAMLQELEQGKRQLGIVDYGISVTTMEEVFLRVAEEASDPNQKLKDQGSIRQLSNRRMSKEGQGGQAELSILDANSDMSLVRKFFRQIFALVIKRMEISKRDKRLWICQLVIPLVILLIGLGLLSLPPSRTIVPVVVSPQGFGQQPSLPVFVNTEWVTTPIDLNGTTGKYLASPAFDVQPVSVDNLNSFSDYLFTSEDDRKLSVYGSYFLTPEPRSTVIFVNASATQGFPAFLNFWTNERLKQESNSTTASISASYVHFPYAQSELRQSKTVSGISASIIVAIAFCFVPASYIVFIVGERETNAKHLQLISGVNVYSYWLSNYLWDYISFLVPAICCIIIIYIFNITSFVSGTKMRWVSAMIFLYGAAVIPFTYLWSFIFKRPFTAQMIMLLVYIMTGLVLMIVGSVLVQIPSTQHDALTIVLPIFRLFPPFCLGDMVFKTATAEIFGYKMSDMEVSGKNYIFCAWEAVVYFLLVLAIEKSKEWEWFARIVSRSPTLPYSDLPLDEDVAREKKRIQDGQASNALIRLEGLRKTFQPAKMAVNDLWYAVDRGECFGFLGVNGAGKTTALRMLTGDEVPVAGQAFLNNFSIATQAPEVRRVMGYCPQFDALNALMTAEETLYFYARVRGVPESEVKKLVEFLCKRLTLTQDNQHTRPCGTYSGGNKRKLSVAIALIGNPRVVFLDEPSTGMDPVSRRFMWDFISETMGERAVILTTHSMEECEALCHRIGIFVAGELKCLGTSQHLKTRFGEGYLVNLTVKEGMEAQVTHFMNTVFKDVKQLEAYGGSMKYQVGQQELSTAQVFAVLENNKNTVGITAYSVSQTSLEQIFLTFSSGKSHGKPSSHPTSPLASPPASSSSSASASAHKGSSSAEHKAANPHIEMDVKQSQGRDD